jgi:hypothetical protein
MQATTITAAETAAQATITKSDIYTAKLWVKDGVARRLYVNDHKGRAAGYYDLTSGKVVSSTRRDESMIQAAGEAAAAALTAPVAEPAAVVAEETTAAPTAAPAKSYTKADVMRAAHGLRRKGMTMSQALKTAWAVAKAAGNEAKREIIRRAGNYLAATGKIARNLGVAYRPEHADFSQIFAA